MFLSPSQDHGHLFETRWLVHEWGQQVPDSHYSKLRERVCWSHTTGPPDMYVSSSFKRLFPAFQAHLPKWFIGLTSQLSGGVQLVILHTPKPRMAHNKARPMKNSFVFIGRLSAPLIRDTHAQVAPRLCLSYVSGINPHNEPKRDRLHFCYTLRMCALFE